MDAEEYILHSEKKRSKSRVIVLSLLSVVTGFIMLNYLSKNKEVNSFLVFVLDENLNVFIAVISIAMIAAAMLSYLQSGSIIFSKVKNNSSSYQLMRPHINLLRKIESRLESNTAQLRSLSKSVENQKVDFDERLSSRALTSDEKIQLEEKVAEGIGQDAVKKIFATEAADFQETLKRKMLVDRVISISDNIVDRFNKEISRLGWRANINLTIGAIITALGLYILWSLTAMVDSSEMLRQLAMEKTDSDSRFFKGLILPLVPRLSLVVFLELFAYFFLRLYRRGLEEIKYFQNELTNVQSKLASVEISIITSSEDSLRATLDILSKTERNFILEKGQSTVELERAKSDTELSKSLVKLLPGIIKRVEK